VLVVDDNSFNLNIFERMLLDTNCTVLKALGGEKALELISKHDDIDVGFFDINMPIMDGFELMKQTNIYLSKQNRVRFPIYSLTGDTTERTME